MKISVDSKKPTFSFAPKSLEQEVMQNLSLLIGTVRYSLPLAREMGLGSEYLHRPQNAAQECGNLRTEGQYSEREFRGGQRYGRNVYKNRSGGEK